MGFGIGNAVGSSPAFSEFIGPDGKRITRDELARLRQRIFELLGEQVAARCGYHPQPGKDGKMLPTVGIDGTLDLREFQQLKNAITAD